MKDLPEDITELQYKIAKAKIDAGIETPEGRSNSEYKQMQKGYQICVALCSSLVVGGAVGYFLDDLFDTKPFLLLLFLLAGGISGFINAYRSAQEMEEKNN